MKEKETTKEDTGLKTGYVLNRRDVKNVLGERTETREKTETKELKSQERGKGQVINLRGGRRGY